MRLKSQNPHSQVGPLPEDVGYGLLAQILVRPDDQWVEIPICVFGLGPEDEEGYYHHRTRMLFPRCEPLAAALSRRCPGVGSAHKHIPLKGPRPGSTATRCTEAGVYAHDFVEAVVGVLTQVLCVGGQTAQAASQAASQCGPDGLDRDRGTAGFLAPLLTRTVSAPASVRSRSLCSSSTRTVSASASVRSRSLCSSTRTVSASVPVRSRFVCSSSARTISTSASVCSRFVCSSSTRTVSTSASVRSRFLRSSSTRTVSTSASGRSRFFLRSSSTRTVPGRGLPVAARTPGLAGAFAASVRASWS